MNKDLEIKKLCNAIRNYAECELDYGTLKTLKMIEDSASRMAAENAEHQKWYEINHEAHCDVMNKYNEALADITELKKEIACLKAELEKRPEIIRCGECDNLIINDDGKYCGIAIDAKRTCNDFCSRGQRRESEEGK